MEEISFKGENYVKASVLAEKYGYTSDYVGQLCRSDQVRATLVGRSWYVNEESLLEHRKGRYRSTLAKSKELVRKLAEEKVQHHLQRPTNVKRLMRYEADERGLLPELSPMEDDLARVSVVDDPEVSVEAETIPVAVSDEAPEAPADREDEAFVVPIVRHQRPVVRTVPAYAMERSAAMSRSSVNHRRISAPVPTKKRSMVPALAVALVLMIEMAAVSAALGLEKKLSVAEDGQQLVVYRFEPELLSAAVLSVWRR